MIQILTIIAIILALITIEIYKDKLTQEKRINELMAEYIEDMSGGLLTKEQLLEQFKNEAEKVNE